jgi:putative acetyltransferase
MSDAIVIRPERPDQPEVVQLLESLDRYLAALYPPEANFILSVQELLAPEVSFYVARAGTRVVGTGACRRMPAEPATDGQAYGEIKRMYVDPAMRGQRLGARLLAALEDQLRGDGYRLVVLETGAAQVEAVRLYRRAGYVPRPAFGGYPADAFSVFYGKAL